MQRGWSQLTCCTPQTEKEASTLSLSKQPCNSKIKFNTCFSNKNAITTSKIRILPKELGIEPVRVLPSNVSKVRAFSDAKNKRLYFF